MNRNISPKKIVGMKFAWLYHLMAEKALSVPIRMLN